MIAHRYYGGADPGLEGGLAIVNQLGGLVKVGPMPVVDKRVAPGALAPWLAIDVELWGIELVGAMPGQGRTSMFNFGGSWGHLHGAIGARHRPIEDVRPTAWKKTFSIGGERKKQKAKAIRLACQYWPEQTEQFLGPGGEGMAEAALIAKHIQKTNEPTEINP